MTLKSQRSLIKREKIKEKELKDWEENKGTVLRERELVRKQLEQAKANEWARWKQDNWDIIMYHAYQLWQGERLDISFHTIGSFICNPIKWVKDPYLFAFSYSIPVEKTQETVEKFKNDFKTIKNQDELTQFTNKLREELRKANQKTVAYILRDNVEKKAML